MKNPVLMIIIFLLAPMTSLAESGIPCPDIKELEQTTIKNKPELLQALQKIIPATYDEDDDQKLYSEWKIVTALPFPKTVGKDNEVYYEMAKNFCGQDIADHSWLVRIHFPKWEGKSASASEGQVFLAKHKEEGWFVWFRYH